MHFAHLTDIEKEIFVNEGIELFHHRSLEDRFPGFPRILGNLIEEGRVLMVEESGEPLIQQHLSTFPYFHVKPSKEGIGCVEITFDQLSFFNSTTFKDAIQTKIDEANTD